MAKVLADPDVRNKEMRTLAVFGQAFVCTFFRSVVDRRENVAFRTVILFQ